MIAGVVKTSLALDNTRKTWQLAGKPRELHIDKALAVTNFGGTTAGRTSAHRGG
jgi:hypothetical protein